MPAIKPSLNLDFTKTQQLDPRVSFYRASSATRINKFGRVETVASHAPRFDYDPVTRKCRGLLIEEQRANLITHSDGIGYTTDGWYNVPYGWGLDQYFGSNITPEFVKNENIDGIQVATYRISGTPVQSNRLLISPNSTYPGASITAGSKYTASIYAACSEGYDGGLNICFMWFDSNNTLLSQTDDSVKFMNKKLTRIYSTGTAPSNATQLRVRLDFISMVSSGTKVDFTYTLGGAQLERGGFVTSYIPSSKTFTSRASTATYIGSDGLIKTAASGVGRYQYDPLDPTIQPYLLIEQEATNLAKNSNGFTFNYNPNSLTATQNQPAPDGTTNAWYISNTSGSNGVFNANNDHVAVAANTYVTGSIYIKASGMTLGIVLSNEQSLGGGSFNAVFDSMGNLSPDQASISNASVEIQKLPGGWFRVGMTIRPTRNIDMMFVFNGIPTGRGISYFGRQFELGKKMTSYIPTTGVAATRAADNYTSSAATRIADNASVAVKPDWLNTSEGTFTMSGCMRSALDVFRWPFCLRSANSVSLIGAYKSPSIPNIAAIAREYATSYTQSQFDIGSVRSDGNFKLSIGYSGGEILGSCNGNTRFASGNVAADMSRGQTVILGCGDGYICGHIASFQYFPKRFSDSEYACRSFNPI